jgi:hypothetical protein|tara:strand:+ start:325 stop:513 length:189 start_codon:yes stop_codon:yes gene_type:complete
MDAKAPYKAGGWAFTLSGASGEATTNLGAKETAGGTGTDKTVINGLIDILVRIGATVVENNS